MFRKTEETHDQHTTQAGGDCHEKQIDQLLDRVVEASSPSVVKRYEPKIDELERQRIVLAERQEGIVPPKGRLEDCIELTPKSLAFIRKW
ncbi:MAG: hypothetical protein AAGE38_02115 [Pseudomonadota bacterium]